MSTNTKASPAEFVKTAEQVVDRISRTHIWQGDCVADVAKAIHDAVMAERERCARLIEEGYERGIATKRDRCAHSKFEWEDCDECAVAAIRAAPKAEG
ncbi:hypothetical protein [Shinella pollutisoli]|uniref:Uncharacterized protein n=1 Tax=Shinella pollutisoli TaxID=2250594 RepID=A0ABV7DBS0_9HYPH|nr:hypothetical protein [Shinella pollutisoli]